VLVAVLDQDTFDLSVSDYDYIESLDVLLAVMLRVSSYAKRHQPKMTEEQRWLWHNMFKRYWINKMYSRPEVKRYIVSSISPITKLCTLALN
jgi:hypothetical protein